VQSGYANQRVQSSTLRCLGLTPRVRWLHGFRGLVLEPQRDHRAVNAMFEKVHGCGMTTCGDPSITRSKELLVKRSMTPSALTGSANVASH
jgi:hypothetical protein